MAKAKQAAAGMRRTITTTTKVEPASEPANDGEEIVLGAEPEGDERDVIRQLLDAVGGEEVEIQVYQVSPVEKAGFCKTYAAGDLSLDAIRDEWGGGRFKIVAKNATTKRYIQRVMVTLRETQKPVAQQSQVGEIIAALKNNATPPAGVDMSGMILAMIKSQGDLLTALITRPQATAPTLDPAAMQKNMLEGMLAMRELFAPPAAAEKGSTTLDILMKGLSLGKQIGGGGKDWTDVAMHALEVVEPVVAEFVSKPRQRVAASATPQAAPPAQLSAPTPAPAAPVESTQGEGGSMLQILAWLKKQVGALVHQASAGGKNPGLYAEVMLDNLPKFVPEALLRERLQSPTAVDDLAKIDERVLEHRQWFEDFRTEALRMMEPPAPDTGRESQPDPETGE